MNLSDAIKNSCNIYFYIAGPAHGHRPDRPGRAPALGLGRKTGIDLAGEKEGLVPSTDWKKKALKEPLVSPGRPSPSPSARARSR